MCYPCFPTELRKDSVAWHSGRECLFNVPKCSSFVRDSRDKLVDGAGQINVAVRVLEPLAHESDAFSVPRLQDLSRGVHFDQKSVFWNRFLTALSIQVLQSLEEVVGVDSVQKPG